MKQMSVGLTVKSQMQTSGRVIYNSKKRWQEEEPFQTFSNAKPDPSKASSKLHSWILLSKEVVVSLLVAHLYLVWGWTHGPFCVIRGMGREQALKIQ